MDERSCLTRGPLVVIDRAGKMEGRRLILSAFANDAFGWDPGRTSWWDRVAGQIRVRTQSNQIHAVSSPTESRLGLGVDVGAVSIELAVARARENPSRSWESVKYVVGCVHIYHFFFFFFF